MPDLPFFFTQLIDLTKRGHIDWEEIRPFTFRCTSGGDADVFVKSRDGNGTPPYVIVISSEGEPGSETTGDTDDVAYNEAFGELFTLASASAGSSQPAPPPV